MTDAMTFVPLAPERWDPKLSHLRGGFAERLNIYRTMAHHPDLLAAWSPLRQHVVVENVLGAACAEIVILRAARHLGSEYEQSHHIIRGRTFGLTDDRIAAVLGQGKPVDDPDATLVAAVDELAIRKALSPNVISQITNLFGAQGVLDLIAIVGFYTTLGLMLNSFETPIDSVIVEELTRRPLAPASRGLLDNGSPH